MEPVYRDGEANVHGLMPEEPGAEPPEKTAADSRAYTIPFVLHDGPLVGGMVKVSPRVGQYRCTGARRTPRLHMCASVEQSHGYTDGDVRLFGIMVQCILASPLLKVMSETMSPLTLHADTKKPP